MREDSSKPVTVIDGPWFIFSEFWIVVYTALMLLIGFVAGYTL